MRKIKITIKETLGYVLAIIKMPHFLTVIVLLLLAVGSLEISYHLQDTVPFFSSVFSNIFAGLVTGIAVYIISGVKNIFVYSTEGKIKWLNSIHSDYLSFNNHYKSTLQKIGQKELSPEELYNQIYDLLCEGNNIPATIAQSQYDKKLSFNPYKFFLKTLKYDAVQQMKLNNETRDIIMDLDTSRLTPKRFLEIFDNMEHSLFLLNASIISKIKELEITQNISHKSIF